MIQKPSIRQLMQEFPRATSEIASLSFRLAPLIFQSPKAPKLDNPILLLPGYMVGDGAMTPLSFFLKRIGYQPHGWQLGRNVEPADMRIRRVEDAAAYRDHMAQRVCQRVDQIRQTTGKKVTLIGWSMGGCIGLDAVNQGAEVNTLITLGSPFGDPRGTSMWNIMRAVQPGNVSEHAMDFSRWLDRTNLREDSPNIHVMFSKRDGIVGEQIARLPEHPKVKHVEVVSSHMGFATNPTVYKQIARILAAAPDTAP
ncbi:Uncharacterised protein [BD1-7 clade bacterium]|uniref:AB hydrolase-1 domain-containing protein n=1 Tax=BD1-7 clade bacterium TaxID=2029982 RepID=A0A5S9PT95_9GAMM|nr:Uncharacterised protein [BD1-7 clade bacterium]